MYSDTDFLIWTGGRGVNPFAAVCGRPSREALCGAIQTDTENGQSPLGPQRRCD